MTNDKIKKIDLNLIKKNIDQYNSQRLCEMVVCHRYLGLTPELSIICMEELAKRRVNGDVFDFENYIEIKLKELPKLDFSMPSTGDIMSTLTQMFNRKLKS